MEVHIPKKSISCLQCIKSDIQTVEETQELRIPEQMPDVGRILSAWGQVLLRGKEWRDDSMTVSGGVMAWVLYMPEGEAQQAQTAQAWIPFQAKWDLPQTELDGTIRALPLLQSVDARTTSARKIVVRTSVSILAEAFLQKQAEVCTPEETPENVHLLKRTYPLLLPREAGEKAFEMEEELNLPQTAPQIAEIVRFSLHPELIDRKVLSGKVVFRGRALLHLLYISEAGNLCTWDFEIPFSQYAQLDMDYEQEAQSRVLTVLTALELDAEPEGKLRLKAGITGQYMIYDVSIVTVVEDAYSSNSEVNLRLDTLQLPTVLDMVQKTTTAEQSLHQNCTKLIDTVFYPCQPRCRRNGESADVELGGMFHYLYLDESGALNGSTQKWQGKWNLQVSANAELQTDVQPSGTVQESTASGQTTLKADLFLDSVACTQSQLPMVSSLETGADRQPDPNRPSLILQRKGSQSLWELAKMNGSTVEAIICANGLEGEGEPEQMLLIPVL